MAGRSALYRCLRRLSICAALGPQFAMMYLPLLILGNVAVRDQKNALFPRITLSSYLFFPAECVLMRAAQPRTMAKVHLASLPPFEPYDQAQLRLAIPSKCRENAKLILGCRMLRVLNSGTSVTSAYRMVEMQ
jgi:hypothetical protein